MTEASSDGLPQLAGAETVANMKDDSEHEDWEWERQSQSSQEEHRRTSLGISTGSPGLHVLGEPRHLSEPVEQDHATGSDTAARKLLPAPSAAAVKSVQEDSYGEASEGSSMARRRRSSARDEGMAPIVRRRPSIDPSSHPDPSGRPRSAEEIVVEAQRRRDNLRRASLFGRTLSDERAGPSDHHHDHPMRGAAGRRLSVSSSSHADHGPRTAARRRTSLFARSAEAPAAAAPQPSPEMQALLSQLHPDLLNYAPDVEPRRPSDATTEHHADADAPRQPPSRRRGSLFTRSMSAELPETSLLLQPEFSRASSQEVPSAEKKMPFRGRRVSIAPQIELPPMVVEPVMEEEEPITPVEPPVDPDVRDALEWVIATVEEVQHAPDSDELLWQTIRDLNRRTTKAINEAEARRVDDLFTELDTNMSGGLDWNEVRQGAAVLGNIDEKHLRTLFAKLCNQWREVGRMQFNVLVRSVKYSAVHGGTFVLECVEAVNALRAKGASKDEFGRRASSSGSMVDDLAMNLITGPEEAASDAVKALAAQKLCYISRHGQTHEKARRQSYIASMGALPALLRAMKAADPQCQHWSVQALIQLVEHNQEVADNFTDIGGITIVADLIQTPGVLLNKAQAGALFLIDATCNASRHGRRSLMRRQRHIIDFAVRVIDDTMFPPKDSDRPQLVTARSAPADKSRAPAQSELYWPLVSSAVELLATLSCEAIVRPDLLRAAKGPGLLAVVTSGRTPASCLAAALAVAMLMGASWPSWVAHTTRMRVISVIVDALEKGTFTSSDGYESVWKVCMAVEVLAGNSQNRWEMRAMGVKKTLQHMLEVGAGKMHPATQAECCLAMWQFSFDDGPFKQIPIVYTAPEQERAPRRLYHLIEPMEWPLKESLGEIESIQLVVDDWEVLGAEPSPVVPGRHQMDVLKLLDLRGNVLWEKWLCDLVARVIAGWKKISPAFKAATTTADDGMSLSCEELQSLFESLVKHDLHFTAKEVRWLFDAAAAPTGRDHVTLHDLRALGEAQSVTFLEELGPNLVQGRRLQWRRGHVAWQRVPVPVQSENLRESDAAKAQDLPVEPAVIPEVIKGDLEIRSEKEDAGGRDADSNPDKLSVKSANQETDETPMDDAAGKHIDAFREFVAGASFRDVGGEEVYTVKERDVTVYRDGAGVPLRAVFTSPREDMHLEVVGWEWSPEKLLRVVESEDDDERNFGKGDVVWDAKNEAMDFLLRAVTEGSIVEPEPAEWIPEDDDDDDEDFELLGKTRQERTHDEAMAILQRGEVRDLQEAMVVAEREVLHSSFHEVDADGSGRVDPEEVLNALREMGLAATEADVKEMMEAVDVGGKLRAVKATVLDMRARAATFDLGLKESERLELIRLEEEMVRLQTELDIDDEGNFGFAGYTSMVHLNDASSHQLPRMAPFPQNLFVGKRLDKYLFRNVRSRPWLSVYDEHPRTVENLREISLQGLRPMGLQVSIFEANACEKNAHGALMVCGEQPVVPPVSAIGFAFLSYDASAQEYVQDVKNVLKEVGMRAVDDRAATHFQMQVRSAGVVIAVMTESFQYSAQCRTELMLARQLGKTVVLLQVELFEVREVWLTHLLGIPMQRPTLFHTLPSCATWLRGSRSVTTTLSPPYTHVRPPIPAFSDTYSYFVQSEGTVAMPAMVTLVKNLGWMLPEQAPLRQLCEGVQERGDIDKEVITGPMVIDFRRSPIMPTLQQNWQRAESALEAVRKVHDEAAEEGQSIRGQLKAAESALEDATAVEDEWDAKFEAESELLPKAERAHEQAKEQLKSAEQTLKTAQDVVTASAEVEQAFLEVGRAQAGVQASAARCHETKLHLQRAQQAVAKAKEAQRIAKEREALAGEQLRQLRQQLQIAQDERDQRKAELQREIDRAAIRPQTEEAVEALKLEIGQYQRLFRMGLFFGNATFFKCWIRICLYAGARVQMKRKMAPYMKRPMFYGFDALAWNREEMKKKRVQMKKAVTAFYGNVTRSVYLAWKWMCKTKHDAQAEAEMVLKHFLVMWGESRKVDCFRAWHRAQIIRKNARELAHVRRTERTWWKWLDHWESMVATFQAVAVKCAKFLAMLTGQTQVDSFHAWKRLVANKKKAATYRSNKNRRMIESIFEWWVQFEKESRLERRLHGEARDKLKALLKALASDKVADCFRGWDRWVRKKLASLRMWRETHLTKAWVSWFAILEEFYEIKRAVTSKCARLLMMLSGDVQHKCFFAWKDLLAKKRAAVRRWTHSSLIACWSRWASIVDEAIRVRNLLANVHKSWGQRATRSSFLSWAEHADERLYNRQLVADAINMWTNVHLIHSFRTLDEHARAAIHYRTVVGNFRTRFRLRPAQISLLALSALVRDKRYRQDLTSRVAFKYKNRWAVICFNRMREEVQDTKIDKAMTNAQRSDILMRMKQRSLIAAFPYWVEGVQRSKVLRKISFRIWAKVRLRWLSERFDRWANLFVDISFEDRHDELKKAAWAALEGGGDLDHVVEVLSSHPVWSKPRPHSRVAPHLEGFLLIREEFDPEAYNRAVRNKERREQLRFEKQQVGARARWDEEMKLKVGDVLKLQHALAQIISYGAMYWRMIEGLSVILKKQNPHPPIEGEVDPEREQSTLGSEQAMDVSMVDGEVINGSNLLQIYAETPAPSARDVHVLDGIGWHQIAKISLTNTKTPTLQQILPSYLGGRWAGMAVKRLHEQVHELYPLKQTKRWADEEQGLQLEEKKRRFLRARTQALELIQRQRAKVRVCATDLSELQKAAADREEESQSVQKRRQQLLVQAAQLDDEDPFEHKKTIKTLRARAAGMEADEAAAQEKSAAAQTACEDAMKAMRAEEARLMDMVVRIAELLRGEEEAKQLMLWQDDQQDTIRVVHWEDGGPKSETADAGSIPNGADSQIGEAEKRRAKFLGRRFGSESDLNAGALESKMDLTDHEGLEVAMAMVELRRGEQEDGGAERVAWIEAMEKAGETSSLGGVSSFFEGSVCSDLVSEVVETDSPDSTSRWSAIRGKLSPVPSVPSRGRSTLPGSRATERTSSVERSVSSERVPAVQVGADHSPARIAKLPRLTPPSTAATTSTTKTDDSGNAKSGEVRPGEDAPLPALSKTAEADNGTAKQEHQPHQEDGRSTPILPPIVR